MTRLFIRLLFVLSLVVPARAGAQEKGFQLNRFEPTAAGSWMFGVDHPWYSSLRRLAVGLTLDYGHNPLVFGTIGSDGKFVPVDAVVAHQLIAHVDLAASFWDRLLVSATMPFTLLESGNEGSTSGISPLGGVGAGDPRIGAMVRIWNHAERDAVSLHAGASLWIPIGAADSHQGDANARFLPKIVAAGIVREAIRWSASFGFLVRSEARLGAAGMFGNTAGSEIQIGLAAGYSNHEQTLHVGPEILLATEATNGKAFDLNHTSLEMMLGGHMLFKDAILVGAAIGTGFLTEAGTPDLRILLRAAWAPLRDSDGDGVVDRDDACPEVPGDRTADRHTNGCPADRDHDGVVDAQDACPDEARGDHPDPKRIGCPLHDRDADGVYDAEDLCPDVPKGRFPDDARLGCPKDSDKDGVLDENDQCVDVPAGKVPDPARAGCPKDTDKDGVIDEEDECVEVPAGATPDPAHKGCPILDRDHDTVNDAVDACPDKPGAPDPDPKKNGCPGLVEVKNGMIMILEPVFFATDKDIILPRSYPVLDAVANVLKAQPSLKKVGVEGHTDGKGKFAHNMDLSDRRAKSVVRFLIGKGIVADRLTGKGFGPTRPIAPNTTEVGRARNRRVEFHILDPAPTGAEAAPPPPPPAPKGAAPRKFGKRRRGR